MNLTQLHKVIGYNMSNGHEPVYGILCVGSGEFGYYVESNTNVFGKPFPIQIEYLEANYNHTVLSPDHPLNFQEF